MNDGLDNPSRNRDEIERSAGIRQQSFSLRGETSQCECSRPHCGGIGVSLKREGLGFTEG